MLTVGVLWSAGANSSLGVCGVMNTGRGSEVSGVGPAAWPPAAWAEKPAATALLHSSATVVPGSRNPVEMTRLPPKKLQICNLGAPYTCDATVNETMFEQI